SRSPSAREQSSCVQVSSNAWKVPPTFATATGKLSISTLSTSPGWLLFALATVTNRAMCVSFLAAPRPAGPQLRDGLRHAMLHLAEVAQRRSSLAAFSTGGQGAGQRLARRGRRAAGAPPER